MSMFNLFFVLGMALTDSFFLKTEPKYINFQRFLPYFFQNYWRLQLKLLKLIESPNIFHWKSAKKKVDVSSWAKFGPN